MDQGRAMVRTDADRAIGLWLASVAGLVALMVVVGGLTRLTESGLSITEWRPLTGILPPLNEGAWLAEFAKYQTIPQYAVMNHDMTLEEFKVIYFWEWFHRLLGRVVGFAFALPALVFFVQGRLTRADLPRMAMLFLLGGAQGALGWWMVQSGLSERINVSQYRLAAHLGLAVLIFCALVWSALDRLSPRTRIEQPSRIGALLVIAVYLQMLMGAIVAGLRAGYVDNTWPLMEGGVLPSAFARPELGLRDVFEEPTIAQFTHRVIAYGLAALVAWAWWRRDQVNLAARRALNMVGAVTLVQISLGVATLVLVMPLGLAAAHQLGALALLTLCLWLTHRTWPAK